jgi:site-specific DNA recombinase
MNAQLRAVVGARVSVLKGPEKVSHIAQREAGVRHAEREGWQVVGYFEDLDVSASVAPWDRPDLGPWLDERAFEWDAMVFAKVDRAFRSAKDCADVAHWAEKNRKVLVFTDDGITLDFRSASSDDFGTMMAKVFLMLAALFAEIELKRFSGRAKASRTVLIATDRWAGGTPPEGYMTAPHPSGKGRALVVDPVRQKMMLEAAERFLTGGPGGQVSSLTGIAKWLTDTGVETRRDYLRPEEKKTGIPWSVQAVIGMFTELSSLGIKMHGRGRKTVPVLDEGGNQIQIAPPIFDDETWARLQDAVKARYVTPRARVWGATPLLGVVYCSCGSRGGHLANFQRGKWYRYYRCEARPRPCSRVSMKADEVEELLEQTFLEECGSVPVLRREFVAGEDHTAELETVKASIARLQRESDAGLVVTEDDERTYMNRMKNLVTRRTELELLPQRSAGWTYEETGETYADAWAQADTQGKRKLLTDAGVRFILKGSNAWEVQIPDDVRERMRAAAAKTP